MAGFLGTEFQTFGSQSLSPSSTSPGNKLKVGINNDWHSAIPFDDTVLLESPSVETLLENLEGGTEPLDIPDSVDNMRTQMVDDIDKEVVPDSDEDEGIHIPKVVSVMKGLSADEIKRRVGGDTLEFQKRQLAPAAKQCNVGYSRRRGTTVGAQSLWANCLARSGLTDRGSDGEHNSIHADTNYQKQQVTKNNGISRVEDRIAVDRNLKEVDRNDDNGKMDFMDEIKSREKVRKISTGDVFVEKEMSSSNCQAMDGGKATSPLTCDHEVATLSYIDSQEPGEPSQHNALDFVDHYLSVIDVNSSQVVEIGKATGMKSPPALSAKGPQSLARIANLRSKVGESGSFDWVDNQTDDGGDVFSSKGKEVNLDCKSHEPTSVSMLQVAENVNFRNKKKLGIQCQEKLQGTIMASNHIHSKSKVQNSNENREMAQNSEMKSNSTQFEEKFNAQSSAQQLENFGAGRDVADIFDVGFDTQMAAEVMESLLFAPSPNSNFSDHQDLNNTLEDSPEHAMNNKASKRSIPKRAVSGFVARKSKGTKRPTNKFSRNMSSLFEKHAENQNELDAELPVTKKVVREKSRNCMNCRDPANSKEILYERPSKVITRRKEGGTPEKESIREVDKNLRSSKSDTLSLGKEQTTSDFRNFSPIARQTRRCSLVHSLKRTEDPTRNSGERMNHVAEVNFLKRRRKRSILDTDVFKVLGMRKKRPKSASCTSGAATNGEVNQQGQTDPNVAATTSHIKLDLWNYPKRKRTHRNMSHHSKGAIKVCAPSTVVDGENGNGHCVGSHKKSEGNSKATGFSINVERKARSTPRFQSSSENKLGESLLRQNSGEPMSGDVINCDSAIMSGQIIHTAPDRPKAALWKSGKLVDVDSISSADGAKENIKFNDLSNANAKALPIYKVGENCKQPCNNNFLRSPLGKELTRLGYAESLPDFASKDLRRRRNMANVRVLFSQRLDDDIIKQQRKILERLGISIASSCSDATHFITDRFVRTRNMLEAIALGKPVVTHLWLESCAQARCFIDEKKYILKDDKKEKEIGFSMPVSLARASQHPLLKGRRVFITPNVEPGKEMIESLVKAIHGQAVETIQRAASDCKMILDDLLIFSCEQDYATCLPFLEEGAAVYSTELLLNGIIVQKLEYERHQLFTNHVKRNCSTTRPP